MVRFQQVLRRLATIDEGFAEDQARLGFDLGAISALDPSTAALGQAALRWPAGSPPACLDGRPGGAGRGPRGGDHARDDTQ
jgi:hypothetical protein